LLSSEETFTGRIAALEEENSTLKAQVERSRRSLEKTTIHQKAFEESLSAAQTEVQSLRQNVLRLESSNHQREMAVVYYRSQVKRLATSLAEVISTVRRVEKQQSEKFLAPPRMM
jgi:exonuclease VII small subunit